MWHVGSCWTRDQTRVRCIGRRILNHWTTREVPIKTLAERDVNYLGGIQCIIFFIILYYLPPPSRPLLHTHTHTHTHTRTTCTHMYMSRFQQPQMQCAKGGVESIHPWWSNPCPGSGDRHPDLPPISLPCSCRIIK